MDNTTAKGKPLSVYLVHGTWPEGLLRALCDFTKRFFGKDTHRIISGDKCWFQREHPFRKGLEDGLIIRGFQPDIRTIAWSGANSFQARELAAANLAEQLSQNVIDGVRQIVVAHSHGGNVIMRALELMRSGADQIEAITMATPFLRVATFGSGGHLSNMVGLCLFLVFFALGVQIGRRYGQDFAYYGLFATVLVAALVARVIQKARVHAKEQIIDKQPGQFLGARILCIRGMSDEADMGISLGIIGCNLIRTLLVFSGKLLGRAPISLIVAGYFALFGVGVYVLVENPGPISRWFLLVGLVALGFILLAGFSSLLQGALGFDLALAGFGLLTTVDSCPDAARDRIEVVTLATTKDTVEGMRHAVYLHPDCISKILESL